MVRVFVSSDFSSMRYMRGTVVFAGEDGMVLVLFPGIDHALQFKRHELQVVPA